MSRAELVERYRSLPLPTTSEEPWRFTDLRGFDPDAFSPEAGGTAPPQSMLELDVAAVATVTESGVEIDGAPDGVTFTRLDENHPRLYELVGSADKFTAHNAAVWKHGVLVEVAAGVQLDRPLYVRVASGGDGAALFYRLLVVATGGRGSR